MRRVRFGAGVGSAWLFAIVMGFCFPGLAAEPACPADFRGAPDRLVCSCGPEAVQIGTVWGSGLYTDDSSICVAALHAGVIKPTGGRVMAERRPGAPAYAGSYANGVASNSYGPWTASFVFGTPPKVKGEEPTGCPITAQESSANFVCRCTPTAVAAGGTVWGTDLYTDDSDICRAAVHAGAVGPNGGNVRITLLPGESGYRGSVRNGVETFDYGSWNRTIRIAGE